MTRKRLPIGIQNFREIREDDCYYVDKTGFALRLIEGGSHYFLSRPRRFGKTLLLDTLAELFAGNEALFRGLYVHERWNWGRRFPVLRLSFAEGLPQDRDELDMRIRDLLRINREALGVDLPTGHGLAGTFGVLYAYLASLGRDLAAEDSSNAGRLDLVVRHDRQLFLFEFKLVELDPDGSALEQIKARGYAGKYRGEGLPTHLIGIEFSRKQRNVVGFEVESIAAATGIP